MDCLPSKCRILHRTTAPITMTNPTVDPALATDIIANPSGYYFNVHSQLHSGGFIRDQLKPAS